MAFAEIEKKSCALCGKQCATRLSKWMGEPIPLSNSLEDTKFINKLYCSDECRKMVRRARQMMRRKAKT